jgi:hypothetical protein
MKEDKLITPGNHLLGNLKLIKKKEKDYYIINVEVFKNKFIYFNKFFLEYSRTNRLNNSFRLSDFFKVVIDFYKEELELGNNYLTNTTPEFETFLKMKKKGKIQGSEMYIGLAQSDIFTHTTIKMESETYFNYINCIHSYIVFNDKEMEYHYSMRKFINVLITYVIKNEESFKRKFYANKI